MDSNDGTEGTGSEPAPPDLTPEERQAWWALSDLLSHKLANFKRALPFLDPNTSSGCLLLVLGALLSLVLLVIWWMLGVDWFASGEPATEPGASEPADVEVVGDPGSEDVTATPSEQQVAPEPDLVPLAGEWQVVNLPGSVDCGDFAQPLPPTPVEGGTIEVIDDGARLLATGFAEGTAAIALDRTAASPTRATYVGEVDPLALGAEGPGSGVDSFTLEFTFVFDSPAHFAGNLTGTIEVQGMTCVVERGADGTAVAAPGTPTDPATQEDPGGTGALVVASEQVDDVSALTSCDGDDPTREVVEVDDPQVRPTPQDALEAFLDGPGPHPEVTSGFTELVEPDGTTSYGSFDGDRLVLVVHVDAADDGFAVTGWTRFTCDER